MDTMIERTRGVLVSASTKRASALANDDGPSAPQIPQLIEVLHGLGRSVGKGRRD